MPRLTLHSRHGTKKHFQLLNIVRVRPPRPLEMRFRHTGTRLLAAMSVPSYYAYYGSGVPLIFREPRIKRREEVVSTYTCASLVLCRLSVVPALCRGCGSLTCPTGDMQMRHTRSWKSRTA